jgi:hypothetical protein
MTATGEKKKRKQLQGVDVFHSEILYSIGGKLE